MIDFDPVTQAQVVANVIKTKYGNLWYNFPSKILFFFLIIEL